MSQGINDPGWFIVSELPNSANLSEAKKDLVLSPQAKPLFFRRVILSEAKDLVLSPQATDVLKARLNRLTPTTP